ncbi:hypothetical protein FA13DRAFT_1514150 [Coprinellus micaceus]|uniref:Uncharacterized protein n=1 Tax=Coprinellus micaceus TaxID=71717 RepID=A0A4Y7SLA0_COPMI|nr:hypothetical protein FA13DRAFT_1514150 [Coprinellus micaceus]
MVASIAKHPNRREWETQLRPPAYPRLQPTARVAPAGPLPSVSPALLFRQMKRSQNRDSLANTNPQSPTQYDPTLWLPRVPPLPSMTDPPMACKPHASSRRSNTSPSLKLRGRTGSVLDPGL